MKITWIDFMHFLQKLKKYFMHFFKFRTFLFISLSNFKSFYERIVSWIIVTSHLTSMSPHFFAFATSDGSKCIISKLQLAIDIHVTSLSRTPCVYEGNNYALWHYLYTFTSQQNLLQTNCLIHFQFCYYCETSLCATLQALQLVQTVVWTEVMCIYIQFLFQFKPIN